LLGGRRLAAPVFIDVIRGFYEEDLRQPAPRAVTDVHTDALQTAVVKAYNENNGTDLSKFSDLLAWVAAGPLAVQRASVSAGSSGPIGQHERIEPIVQPGSTRHSYQQRNPRSRSEAKWTSPKLLTSTSGLSLRRLRRYS
jgi:hypothetical protein